MMPEEEEKVPNLSHTKYGTSFAGMDPQRKKFEDLVAQKKAVKFYLWDDFVHDENSTIFFNDGPNRHHKSRFVCYKMLNNDQKFN